MTGSRGPRVLVCRSVGIFVRWDGQVYVAPMTTGCGVNQACPMSRTAPSSPGQGTSWFAGFIYMDWYVWIRLGTDGYGGIRLGLVRFVLAQPEQHLVRGTRRWVPALTESWPRGNPSIDARCGRTRRTGVGEFLASYIGHHLAAPGATPSQGKLTLGVSSHRESTMGEPIDRRLVRLHKVCGRRGRRYPPMGEPIRRGISMPSV